MGLLDYTTAVVTGAAQGIGRRSLRASSAKAAASSRTSTAAAHSVAKELGDAVAVGVGCDVVQSEQVQGAIDAALWTFGSLDVYVNNAGITRDATMRTMTDDR